MSKSLATIFILTAVLLVCSCLVLNVRYPGLFNGKPQACMYVRNPLIDVGTIRGSKGPRRIAFEIENVGRAPLKINRVIGRCPCLKLSLDQDVLLPGETARLYASISAPNTLGKWSDRILLFSNDPQSPLTRLEVRGYVEFSWVIIPHAVYINSLEHGEVREVAFKIVGPSHYNGIRILGIASNNDAIMIEELNEVTAVKELERDIWKVIFSVGYRGIPSWQGKITVSTSDPNTPSLELPVVVNEVPLLRIEPRVVCFIRSPKNPEPTATVEIASNRQGALLTISHVTNPDWLKIIDNTNPANNPVRLLVRILADIVPNQSTISDKITVTFDQNESPVDIPVLVFNQE